MTPCDIFITEATFGLPLFTHPPIEDEIGKLLERLAAHPDRCVLVGAYALGNAQRVISDHADWHELTRTIKEVNPQESWITHGREEALLRWHQLHQRKARALALVGYEDEDD